MKHIVKMSEAKRIIRNHCSLSSNHETLLWYIDQLDKKLLWYIDQLEKKLFIKKDCETIHVNIKEKVEV